MTTKNTNKIVELHRQIFRNRSPFAKMALCALVIGIGDIFSVIADLTWLVGDSMRDYHSYHSVVGIGLVIAGVLMAASFIYLYIAITKYLHNHEVILANRRAKQGFKRVEKAKQKILDNTSKVDHNRDKSNN